MKIKKKYINKDRIILTDLINARVYLGASKSKLYPMSKSFLTGVRNKICIFNLSSTTFELRRFAAFMNKIMSFQQKILFVGLPTYKREEFIALCLKRGHFYVDEEFWIAGLLTNTSRILSHKLKYINDCEKSIDKNDPSLLKENLVGVRLMRKKPDLIIIFNHIKNVDIIHEASRLKTPTILFGNSNVEFKKITYLIPGNFYSEKANKLYYKLITFLLIQRFL